MSSPTGEPTEEPTYAAGAAPLHTSAPSGGTDPSGGAEAAQVDWEALRLRAVEMMERAYAPYSHFPVGVAGLVDDGRVVAGCNVENAAYGVALCAECGMVSELHATGGGRLTAVYCVGRDGRPLMACGRCRQLLWENGGPSCLVMTPEGVLPMSEVLPQAFGPANLEVGGALP
ncbi:cytidine deaminase [Humibacillus xanthopallidus]|uniref:Cytidine deaminase n=1 Tax=Humibacillus xanthopallidus TaxID=412689 RepID=A0A543PXB0_9MICO|nr:cytidine deaminase [Humibacillus xanthopallidus]